MKSNSTRRVEEPKRIRIGNEQPESGVCHTLQKQKRRIPFLDSEEHEFTLVLKADQSPWEIYDTIQADLAFTQSGLYFLFSFFCHSAAAASRSCWLFSSACLFCSLIFKYTSSR